MIDDWRHERDEYIEGKLLDAQDRIDWEHQRDEDLGLDDVRPTHDEMVEHFARERRVYEDRWALEAIAERALLQQWWRDLYERDERND